MRTCATVLAEAGGGHLQQTARIKARATWSLVFSGFWRAHLCFLVHSCVVAA